LISEDFGDPQSYADSYRYFLSFFTRVGVACFCSFEFYSCSGPLKRYRSTVGVSGCVSESVARGMERASRQARSSALPQSSHSNTRITRGQPTSVFNHIQHLLMSVSTTFHLRSTERIGQGAISGHFQSTEGIDQGAIGGEPQRQRYASFSCNVIRLRVNMSDS
jgi:hypothetical protein